MLIFKQFGVGLAAAILIDATLVRGVLLPATMKLLGERDWYLPGWLQWLPHLEPEEPSTAPEATRFPSPRRHCTGPGRGSTRSGPEQPTRSHLRSGLWQQAAAGSR